MIRFLSAARTRISPTILGMFLLLPLGWAVAHSPEQASPPQGDGFQVQLFEDLPTQWRHEWSFQGLEPSLSWTTPLLGISGLPGRISPAGMTMPRNRPFALTIRGDVNLPGGDYEFRLRSRMHARFFVDGRLLLESTPPKPKKLTPEELAAKEAAEKKAREEAAQQEAEAQARQDLLQQRLEDALLEQNEETQKAVAAELEKANRRQKGEFSDTRPPAGIQELGKNVPLESGRYRLRIELTGEKLDREVSVVYRKGEDGLQLLSRGDPIPFTERAWVDWKEAESRRHREVEEAVRRPRLAKWEQYWEQKHLDQARAAAAGKPVEVERAAGMPEFNLIDRFLGARMASHGVEPAPLTNDYEFVRRIYVDVWGLIPTWEQVREFVSDSDPGKRNLLIDRLMTGDGWADPWVGYWQDLLGENPKLYGGVPHSTGPF